MEKPTVVLGNSDMAFALKGNAILWPASAPDELFESYIAYRSPERLYNLAVHLAEVFCFQSVYTPGDIALVGSVSRGAQMMDASPNFTSDIDIALFLDDWIIYQLIHQAHMMNDMSSGEKFLGIYDLIGLDSKLIAAILEDGLPQSDQFRLPPIKLQTVHFPKIITSDFMEAARYTVDDLQKFTQEALFFNPVTQTFNTPNEDQMEYFRIP